jgi:hypothetical protein
MKWSAFGSAELTFDCVDFEFNNSNQIVANMRDVRKFQEDDTFICYA